MSTDLLYVGAGNHVAAVNADNGEIVWETTLRDAFFKAGHDFVTLLVVRDVVYAHSYGHLYALDARTGAKLWENPLKGVGPGLASLSIRNAGVASPVQGAFVRNEEDKEDGGD